MINVILSVLLFILKAIGIIILALIAIIILSLFSLLFVPIRYKAKGNISIEGKVTDLSGDINVGVSWLFHIFSVKLYLHEGVPCSHVKIFGKTINFNEKKSANARKKTHKEKLKKDKNLSDAHDKKADNENKTGSENKVNNENNANEKKADSEKKTNEKKADSVKKADSRKKAAAEQKNDEANGFFKRLYGLYDKIIAVIKRIKFQIIEICDRIKNVNGTRQAFIDFLTTEESRKAIKQIKYRILKILLHLKPLSLRVNADYGFINPAATGQSYGVLCILLSRYGKKINITPHFTSVEKPYFSGDIKLRGRIRMSVLLVHAFKIYKIKRLKEFIAFAKGKGWTNGR